MAEATELPITDWTDWDWLDRAQSGDRSAWQRLVDQHFPRLTNLAYLILGSKEGAMDVAQETFAQLASHLPHHRNGSLGGYLSTIGYHLALKEIQRGKKTVGIGEYDYPDGARSPLESVIRDERQASAAAAIRALEPDLRDILVLRFYGDLSYDEIVASTGLPLGTVKSRIFRAVQKSRDFLVRNGVTK